MTRTQQFSAHLCTKEGVLLYYYYYFLIQIARLGSVLFYKPLSKLANVIYFSHPKMCTNGSQIHTAQPQTVGDIVSGTGLAWLPCDCSSSRSRRH